MNAKGLKGILAVFLMMGAQSIHATIIDQYASSVIDFSSQWSTGSWSAQQILGSPNTFSYGDISTAWAPQPINGGNQFISIGFNTAVYSSGATIRETYGNGFVYQIDVIDLSNTLHTVWSGTDNSAPGGVVDFLASWSETNYLIDGLKIYVDTEHNLQTWEEIDSVQLHGSDTIRSVPEPATIVLLSLGMLGLRYPRKKETV